MIRDQGKSHFQFIHNLCWTAKALGIDKDDLLRWISLCWDAQQKAIEEDDRRRAVTVGESDV